MDQQQWRRLNVGRSSSRSAPPRRALQVGGVGGVCVSMERPDWVCALSPLPHSSGAADHVSVAAGRLSCVVGVRAWRSRVGVCLSALASVHCGAIQMTAMRRGRERELPDFETADVLGSWAQGTDAACGGV